MKIKLLTLFFLSFVMLAKSQGLAVQSFKKLSSDLDARVNYYKTDQNGDKCAIIKIVTTQKGFSWEGDALGIVKTEYKVGEYWLYVPHGARRLTVKHGELGVLRNYVYPLSVKEATVYELVLKSGNVKTIVEDIEIPTQWLVISSTPDSALVYINDIYVTETTFQQELEIGKYTYRIEYPMYHSKSGVLELDTVNKSHILEVKLKKNYGSIALTSQPESGAKVIIDGKDTGKKTPCTIDYLKSGEHIISLRHKWYNPVTKAVIIRDEQETNTALLMDQNYGEVIIVADNESSVYVDGEYKKNGVWEGRLLTGLHEVKIQKERHDISEKQINVVLGNNEDVSINLKGKYGMLKVITSPYDAKIKLNGLYQGNSPLSVSKLLIGDYTLIIEKESFGTITKHIKIEEGKTLSLNETLPVGEEVSIRSSSKDSKIYIDGTFKGETLISTVISPGYHEVQITKYGEIHTEKIRVKDGDSNVWEIETKADEFIRKGDEYYKREYFTSSVSNYQSYLNDFPTGYRNKYARKQIVKVNSVLKDIEEKEEKKQVRAAKKSSRKGGTFMLYSYDEMNPYGFTMGQFNINKLGWYLTFKYGESEYLDNGIPIDGYSMGMSTGITFKLFYPFWINMGAGASYVDFYNFDEDIDFSKMIYYPEAGINWKIGKSWILKYGAQYNFETESYLKHVGIGFVF